MLFTKKISKMVLFSKFCHGAHLFVVFKLQPFRDLAFNIEVMIPISSHHFVFAQWLLSLFCNLVLPALFV